MLKEQATAAAQSFLDSDCVCTAKRNVSPWWPLVGMLAPVKNGAILAGFGRGQ